MSMSILGRIWKVYQFASMVCGIAALMLFTWAFYQMAFLLHGALFYEPNLFIATGEFFTCVFAVVGLLATTFKYLWEVSA